MEMIKRTDEIRVETESAAAELINEVKNKSIDEGYELTSYSSTHKAKKDDDYYVVKLVKTYL